MDVDPAISEIPLERTELIDLIDEIEGVGKPVDRLSPGLDRLEDLS